MYEFLVLSLKQMNSHFIGEADFNIKLQNSMG